MTRAVTVSSPTFDNKFVDAVSGTSTSTIIAGDSVNWIWQDPTLHSTTSGTCGVVICTADNHWNSGKFGAPHNFTETGTFQTAGVYPYFCLVHTVNMLGNVIVQDYTLALAGNSVYVLPGKVGTLNGTLTGLPGPQTINGVFYNSPYNSAVNLDCENAVPRVPATCNANSATPLASPGTPVTFNLGDNVIGDYTFDAVGTGLDPDTTIHKVPVTLHVVNYALTAPSPSTVTLVNTQTSAPITFQVTAMGASFNNPAMSNPVTLSCGGLPVGAATCNFMPSATIFPTAGTPVSVTLTIQNVTAVAGNYPLTINAATTSTSPAANKSQPLTMIVQRTGFSIAALVNVTTGVGFSITVTAQDPSGNVNPAYTGTVQLTSTDNAAVLPVPYMFTGSGAGKDNGVHTFNGVVLNTTGMQTISVSDGTNGATSAPINVNNSITSVMSSANPVYFKNASRLVSFSATVAPASGIVIPQGSVTFMDGNTPIGPAVPLDNTGKATLPKVGLSAGSHTITAVYNGNAGQGLTGSVSAPLLQEVSPKPRPRP